LVSNECSISWHYESFQDEVLKPLAVPIKKAAGKAAFDYSFVTNHISKSA